MPIVFAQKISRISKLLLVMMTEKFLVGLKKIFIPAKEPDKRRSALAQLGFRGLIEVTRRKILGLPRVSSASFRKVFCKNIYEIQVREWWQESQVKASGYAIHGVLATVAYENKLDEDAFYARPTSSAQGS